jgi:hypothetical protein
MINLTNCKTAQEALNEVAKQIGFGNGPAQVFFHKNEVVGLDFKIGEWVVQWRKPKE